MVNLEEIKSALRDHKSELEERFKVKRIAIFGSYAREEEANTSDVDILVDLYEPIGLEIIDLKEFLEEILGIEVDLVTIKALRPELSEIILKEAIYA
ncbi:MAG: nucleotidyltransferase family protein [Thermoplasmata archaeon]|nr:MAG: nucleotidyltransferase family protein [Thermoplasmata archaeon]